MERTSPSPLAQAFAALFAALIAALVEHAAEHPMLAPGIRASIRKLEKLSKQFQAMAAAWEEHQKTGPTRARFTPPQPRRAPPVQRGTPVASPRRGAVTWNPATAPRAPPIPAA